MRRPATTSHQAPLTDGVERYRREYHDVLADHMAQLGSGGQRPQALFVTCSDSRLDPHLFTDSAPGRLFVLRNAGNIVSPWTGERPSACAATVEFAVEGLGVPEIIVCGHLGCGAMAARFASTPPEGLPEVARFVAAWAPASDCDDIDELVRANVRYQLGHLRTHPAVARAEAEGRTRLSGWVFDFVTGALEVLEG